MRRQTAEQLPWRGGNDGINARNRDRMQARIRMRDYRSSTNDGSVGSARATIGNEGSVRRRPHPTSLRHHPDSFGSVDANNPIMIERQRIENDFAG